MASVTGTVTLKNLQQHVHVHGKYAHVHGKYANVDGKYAQLYECMRVLYEYNTYTYICRFL